MLGPHERDGRQPELADLRQEGLVDRPRARARVEHAQDDPSARDEVLPDPLSLLRGLLDHGVRHTPVW
jgi:hypothetical protein